MKIISWNVNGINACTNKGAIELLKKECADIYCFQEVKSQKDNIPKIFEEYYSFHSFAKKKGYSGVSIYSKIRPINVIEGIGIKEFDDEGRIIGLEFEDLFVINVYFPHSHRELKRLDFKLKFNKNFLDFCKKLEKTKPIIIASDFNVAHKEIDLKNPKSNMSNASFTPQEREWFDNLLKKGLLIHLENLKKKEKITLGGHIWTMQEKEISDGE